MLWKPRQNDTFTAYTARKLSDNVELQSCQILSVSVNAEITRFLEKNEVAEFIAGIWVFIVDLLESCLRLDLVEGTEGHSRLNCTSPK